jgi:CYTH domain-containing protein
MNDQKHVEIERKFLIRMPELSLLKKVYGVRIKNITQTYLKTADGSTARVRKIEENNKITFVKTVKNKISNLSHYEDEHEINEEQYQEELRNADEKKLPIIKIRYAFPFNAHTVEIDVYPFWQDRAILEIEMQSEDEEISIPSFIEVIKEVTEDAKYKNTNLALRVPMDEI